MPVIYFCFGFEVTYQIEGGLGILGLANFTVRILEANLGKFVSKGLVSLVNKIWVAGEYFGSHSDGLGTLARK